jgi:hypothetical protein
MTSDKQMSPEHGRAPLRRRLRVYPVGEDGSEGACRSSDDAHRGGVVPVASAGGAIVRQPSES